MNTKSDEIVNPVQERIQEIQGNIDGLLALVKKQSEVIESLSKDRDTLYAAVVKLVDRIKEQNKLIKQANSDATSTIEDVYVEADAKDDTRHQATITDPQDQMAANTHPSA